MGEHAQIHGLYQQQLRHFSEMGVLLAIASKNDPAVAEEALRREDLLVEPPSAQPAPIAPEAPDARPFGRAVVRGTRFHFCLVSC